MLRIDEISDIKIAKQVADLLQKENERLHKRLAELVRELSHLKGQDGRAQLELELDKLQSQMSKLQQKIFGASSERRTSDNEDEKAEKKEAKEPRVPSHLTFPFRSQIL